MKLFCSLVTAGGLILGIGTALAQPAANTKPIPQASNIGSTNAQQAHAQFQQAIVALLQTKDQAKARADFLKAVSLDPTFAAPYYNLGVLEEAQNNWQQAAHWFQEYLKVAPNSKLASRVNAELVHLQVIAGEAITPAGRVRIAYDDDIANARVLLNSGLLKQSITAAMEALKADPKRWEAYAIAASALSQAGQKDKAQKYLSLAIARAPADKKIALNKALADAQVKQQDTGSVASGLIRLTTATLGKNCGAKDGNVTGKVASICNGKSECNVTGREINNPDPAFGCAKDFSAQWECVGHGSRSNSVPAIANETYALNLSCK